jgi:hypothetical protein
MEKQMHFTTNKKKFIARTTYVPSMEHGSDIEINIINKPPISALNEFNWKRFSYNSSATSIFHDHQIDLILYDIFNTEEELLNYLEEEESDSVYHFKVTYPKSLEIADKLERRNK